MEEGGVLTVATRLNPARPDEVTIEVRDTGHGIPAAVLPKIFEPFYTTKPPGRGTGLGLSICYGIIELHRGRIEVDSEPGLGSSFRVYLPIAVGVPA
jgi:two-component system NtrC family sensor kinase